MAVQRKGDTQVLKPSSRIAPFLSQEGSSYSLCFAGQMRHSEASASLGKYGTADGLSKIRVWQPKDVGLRGTLQKDSIRAKQVRKQEAACTGPTQSKMQRYRRSPAELKLRAQQQLHHWMQRTQL